MTTMTTIKGKPFVCICDFTVRYVEKKHINKVKHKDPKVSKKYSDMYVKEFNVKHYPITLDANGKFPTKNTEKRVLQSLWKYHFKKDTFENFVVFVKNINILNKTVVSYDFDYAIH